MEISYEKLLKYIERDDKRMLNFFDTFGFVVVRNVLSKSEFKKLLKEYDQQYLERSGPITLSKMLKNRLGPKNERKIGFKEILSQLRNRVGMRFLPNFVDGSDVYTKFFIESEKYQQIYNYFARKDWLYLGSDGSNFVTTSFPWHRDWYTKMPLLKFNFYYNPLPFFGGKFLIIPGSNFTQDEYSSRIQSAMSWPMQNEKPGGMSENDFLPDIRNPRDVFNKGDNFDIPHVQVKLNKGDVVIFDHRCVHAVQNTWPKFQRRLMTILISKNAFHFDDNHPLLEKFSRDELMSEVTDLIVNERNHIGCPPYGDALMRTNFINTSHFIHISKKDSERYNFASFRVGDSVKKYEVDFDKYQRIGSEYRNKMSLTSEDVSHSNSQNYGYKDVHLGINAQNVL